ncbi:MAG: HEAT repeat domain-containing protein, partial [Sedimentisphaerales bacterium]
MFNGKTVVSILAIVFFAINTGFCQLPMLQGSGDGVGLEENWNDFLHYTKIGRFDLAKGYAQAVLQSDPDPVRLFELSTENPAGFSFLLRVQRKAPDAELAGLAGKILNIVEQGRFIRRRDPRIIVEEIKRLSGTERGKLTAVKRLQNAGEYAIAYMLDAVADESREDELPNIVWALPQIGRPAIRPLVAALQTENIVVKSEIIKALGEIGYPQSLAYLKYIVEKDDSDELRKLAAEAIRQIDPIALGVPAAELFFRLAENYYYHSESLAPVEDADFANIWFWDSARQRLTRQEVDKSYFNELMAMRCCEWALKADPGFGLAIGLWLAAFFKAEATGLTMPAYFGERHAGALVYATTAGPEYLHQALARAIKDKNADVALGAVEALATTAGEKSLLYTLGPAQPLLQALSFNDRAVRYSAAIAVALAGPQEGFAESRLVVENLAEALGQMNEGRGTRDEGRATIDADSYAFRAAEAMLKLAETRNRVIDLSLAQSALINATKDKRRKIQVLAGQILAYLNSPSAQRAIAAMALDSNNELDVRILAFNSLATSAKINANMLVEETLAEIYALISSDQTDPDLRSAAAAAYGALNLPSRKVKDLILD